MNNFSEKFLQYKPLLAEFIRYAFVGAIASVVDLGVGFVMRQFVLPQDSWALYAATTSGFIGGLVVNYILSMLFVFVNDTQQKQGKTLKAFLVFALVGLIGLVFTNIGMGIGDFICQGETYGIRYIIVRVIVMALVLIWNYAGRKIFVFKEDK